MPSDAPIESGNPQKRIRLTNPSAHLTGSRFPYVAKACNECKRRKLKCDGNFPCNRCTTSDAGCSYDRPHRIRDCDHIGELRNISSQLVQMERRMDHFDKRFDVLSDGSDTTARPVAAPPQANEAFTSSAKVQTASTLEHEQDSNSPTFRGPTSTEFTFNVARSSLQRFPALGSNAVLRSQKDLDITFSSELLAGCGPFSNILLHDPLWDLEPEEVGRLVHVFAGGPGSMYPVFNIPNLLSTSRNLFQLLKLSRKKPNRETHLSAAEALLSHDTITLKMVIANALTLESCGVNDQAQKIFNSIRDSLGSSFWSLPDLRKVINWLLVALLHFHLDEDLQASRVVAHAARLCLEMGINRKDGLKRAFRIDLDKSLATKLFWSIFILDRRCSIALGIPYVIQDCDIDLTIPDSDPGSLYLHSLVGLSRLSGRACRIATELSDKSLDIPKDELDYLDYQVIQWQRQIPEEFKYSIADLQSYHVRKSPLLFQSVVLALRTNQMRNLIHRPVLYSTQRIMENQGLAKTAVDVAREALKLLFDVNSWTDFLQTHPVFFKYFLISAFSVLVLAVANGPGLFAHQVNQEFFTAMDLFKLMSSRSPTLMRLWNSVKSLEHIAPQLGLSRSLDDNISSAHPAIDHDISDYNGAEEHPDLFGPGSNQLTNELSSLLATNSGFPNWFDLVQVDGCDLSFNHT